MKTFLILILLLVGTASTNLRAINYYFEDEITDAEFIEETQGVTDVEIETLNEMKQGEQ